MREGSGFADRWLFARKEIDPSPHGSFNQATIIQGRHP
jgi:hypothetical protein